MAHNLTSNRTGLIFCVNFPKVMRAFFFSSLICLFVPGYASYTSLLLFFFHPHDFFIAFTHVSRCGRLSVARISFELIMLASYVKFMT